METAQPTKIEEAWIAKSSFETIGLSLPKNGSFQKLRREAENPQTPSVRLEAIRDQAEAQWRKKQNKEAGAGRFFVNKAIAVHPNAPPHLLRELMDDYARDFCHNPVAPFLLLEQPDFAARLTEKAQMALLREAAAPAALVRLLADGGAAQSANVREAARLHIAFAGEANGAEEWENALRDYWQRGCVRADGFERQWNVDLAETGLAPDWAKGPDPVPEPMPPPAVFPILDQWFRFAARPDSPEETALLQRIGPGFSDLSVLARGLRKSATPADLRAVLDAQGNADGLVQAAVLHHPAINANVIEKFAGMEKTRFHRMMLQLEATPASVLQPFIKRADPAWRRLARRHPNAPPDALEMSKRFYATRVKQDDASSHFVSFVGSLHFGDLRPAPAFLQRAESVHWTRRLEAVFITAQNPDVLRDDEAGRTTDDLLHYLATHDGNRLVRAAAETHLVDSNYRFVLGN